MSESRSCNALQDPRFGNLKLKEVDYQGNSCVRTFRRTCGCTRSQHRRHGAFHLTVMHNGELSEMRLPRLQEPKNLCSGRHHPDTAQGMLQCFSISGYPICRPGPPLSPLCVQLSSSVIVSPSQSLVNRAGFDVNTHMSNVKHICLQGFLYARACGAPLNHVCQAIGLQYAVPHTNKPDLVVTDMMKWPVLNLELTTAGLPHAW